MTGIGYQADSRFLVLISLLLYRFKLFFTSVHVFVLLGDSQNIAFHAKLNIHFSQ